MIDFRTDLAIEAREIYHEQNMEAGEIEGVDFESAAQDGIAVTRVKVKTDEGGKALGKSIGNYITLEIPDLPKNSVEIFEKAACILADELKNLIGDFESKVTLVAGLGNREITPDSLGPRVVSSLVVTRHLFENMPQNTTEGLGSVCAVAPGVLGLTGIETGEIISGIAEHVRPDVIIAVDALAARSMSRVCTTVQITDAGISPGSGVGNHRKALNKETMGVPVIALGVPMVVNAATIANDTIDKIIDTLIANSNEGKGVYEMLKKVDREEKYKLITESLNSGEEQLIVTPKNIDYIAERISKIVANGLNFFLHPDITKEEIESFIS